MFESCPYKPADLPPLEISSPSGFDYPLIVRLSQLVWTLFEGALVWLGISVSWGWWRALAARLGMMAGLTAGGQQVRQKLLPGIACLSVQACS